jgi:hypothetical protein
LTLDLGGNVSISKFALWTSTYDVQAGQMDNRLPSTFKLLGRLEAPPVPDNDENAWTLLEEFTCDYSTAGEHLFILTSSTEIRYLKFIGTNGGGDATYMAMGEMDIYAD